MSVRDALILRTWDAGVHYLPWGDQRQWIVVDKINGRVTRWRTERQAEQIWKETDER